MNRTLALAAAAVVFGMPNPRSTFDGEVTTIRVQPTMGSVEVEIGLRGSVDVQDFTLDAPARIVLDVMGARLANPAARYDQVNRGGIRDIRYAQFRSDVVRVVIELEAMTDYTIERDGDALRVSMVTERRFSAWSSDLRSLASAVREEFGDELESTVDAPPVQEGTRISVVWDSASLTDVMASFAAFSGRSIILGKDVDGFVSAEIRNQPWDVAFRAILSAQGLEAEVTEEIIVVDSREAIAARDTIQQRITVPVRLNYSNARALVNVIQPILTARGQVSADTITNSLIITEVASRIDEVEQFVRGLDVRTPQVAIVAKIIFVDRLDVEELGVQYDIGTSSQFFNRLVQRPNPTTAEPVDTDLDGVPDALVPTETFGENQTVIDLGGNSLAAVANAEATVLTPALDLIYSTALGNFDITTFVQALQRVELADIQAEPVTTVLDNRQASILVGDRVPIRTVDAGATTVPGGQGVGAQPIATVDFEETGIRLVVTPHVTEDRHVLMEIHAERSAVRPAPVDIGFTFQTQEATTQVLVADGETAVVGGLTVTEVTVVKTGIPFLVDLPIIGRLFGFSSQQEIRRDLLILVTPHIIDDLQVGRN